MTKEQLIAKRAEIEAHRLNAVGNLNAITGALQVLDELIAACDTGQPGVMHSPSN